MIGRFFISASQIFQERYGKREGLSNQRINSVRHVYVKCGHFVMRILSVPTDKNIPLETILKIVGHVLKL